MRLTLRTLLAYLDDILEPKQTKDLGEKIADSHFATSLINRIREILRRRRLTAPTLSGPGAGIDPNTVAEYLDNTLAPEKVADMEKTCLESDIHLAEVAGCHQILTLVLGEPVDIVPESRERIYALTAPDIAPQQTQTAVEPKVATPPAPAPEPRHPEPVLSPSRAVSENDFRKGIPDYLRKPPLWKRTWPYAAVVVVVLLIAIPFMNLGDSQQDEILDDSQNGAPVVALGAGQPELPEQNNEPDPAQEPIDDPQIVMTDVEDPEPSDAVGEESTDVVVAQNDDLNPLTQDDNQDFSIDAPAPDDNDIEVPVDLPDEISSITTLVPDAGTGLFPPSESTVPEEPELSALPQGDPGEEALVTTPNAEDDGTEPNPPAGDQVAVVGTSPKRLDPVPETPPVVQKPVTAQYLFPDGIVLINDPKEEGWRKLAPRSRIHPGDRLAVPEPFHASFRLSEGDTHLTLLPGALNGTSVELVGPTQAANYTLKVRRGRLVFRGSESEDVDRIGPVEIGLIAGNELWQVKFLTPDAVWGLEITPRQPEGFEEDLGANRFSGALYVLQGTIQFSDGKDLKIDKAGPGWIPLTPGQRPKVNAQGSLVEGDPLQALPNWLEMSNSSRKQAQHSPRFAREFDEVQPIEISLVGAIDDRNSAIATLGVKCFALTEDYSQLVEALSQPEHHKDVRRAAADGIRDWLPTDPENGAKLNQALSKFYHEDDAAVVYKLLWGLPQSDAEQLEPSIQLVRWMEHESLTIRELAYDQVLRLTDKQGTSYYRPDDTASKREKAIKRLEERVDRNRGFIRR